MKRFIARENIRRFKVQLENCTDEGQKKTLKGLIAAAWAVLKEQEGNHQESAKPSDLASQDERDPLLPPSRPEADLKS